MRPSRATQPGSAVGRSARWSALRAGGLWRWVAIVLLLAMPGASWAAPASAERARRVAKGWRSRNARPLGMELGGAVGRVESFPDATGTPVYHIVYLEPSGFLIMPADDDLEPVIGFVSGGSYDPSASNPLGSLVSQDVPKRVAAARQGRAKPGDKEGAAASARGKWQLLESDGTEVRGTGIEGLSDLRVAPLVQSRWDQGEVGGDSCYNYYTPNHYLCGCVATAMAQVMRFHRFPVDGIGAKPFVIKVWTGLGPVETRTEVTRGGDGSGGAYLWDLMPLVPTSDTGLQERQAIGALCYDAGLSVNTNYNPDSAGAEHIGASALVETFGYGSAIRGLGGDYGLMSGIEGMVNPNLDAGYPVILGIANSPSMHAVVADGYGYDLATAYHHLNMGWSGSSDAWYNLPIVDGEALFTEVFECAYNIFPAGSGEIISGRTLDGAGRPVADVKVTARTVDGEFYTATSNSQGVYALAKVPPNTTFLVGAALAGRAFRPQVVSTKRSIPDNRTAGNVWGVEFVDGPAGPPLALDDTAMVRQDAAGTIQLLAIDDGLPAPAALAFVIRSLPSHGTLEDPNGSAITSVPYTLANLGNRVRYSPQPGYKGTDTFTFTASDGGTAPSGGDSDVATVSASVIAALYEANMDSDPGWSLDPGWEWGVPAGNGSGSHRDPTTGYTGSRVVGYNLDGDYEFGLSPRYATLPPIDCRGFVNIRLRFYRWLGVEAAEYDHAGIEMSNDGLTWLDVWDHQGDTLSDTAWAAMEYILPAAANNQPTVYIRFRMGPTDDSMAYPGWNVDDVQVTGDRQAPKPPMAQPASVVAAVGQATVIALVATDDGLPNPPGALRYMVASLPAHGVLSDPGGGAIAAVPYVLAGDGHSVLYTPAAGYSGPDAFDFKASDGGAAPSGGESNSATVSISVPALLYFVDMESDPGWVLDPGWAWGVPAGGGSHDKDPRAGLTGSRVIGYNLAGDYENGMVARYATSPAFSGRGYRNMRLRFARWLGVESSMYDHACVEVSVDGLRWTTVWAHSTLEVSDSDWVTVEYPLPSIADDQSTISLRWGMGTTDGSLSYPGWNVDDVLVTGEPIPQPWRRADINQDGEIDVVDLMLLAGSWAKCPGDEGYSADCNLDGDVCVDVVDLLFLAEYWPR